ncbi:hypothetical protein PsW64_05492 [Pseudovibrio sp. W64]|nr:hypothetical protein PsW64_05492 [Pseudovibrio sp. W64]
MVARAERPATILVAAVQFEPVPVTTTEPVPLKRPIVLFARVSSVPPSETVMVASSCRPMIMFPETVQIESEPEIVTAPLLLANSETIESCEVTEPPSEIFKLPPAAPVAPTTSSSETFQVDPAPVTFTVPKLLETPSCPSVLVTLAPFSTLTVPVPAIPTRKRSLRSQVEPASRIVTTPVPLPPLFSPTELSPVIRAPPCSTIRSPVPPFPTIKSLSMVHEDPVPVIVVVP